MKNINHLISFGLVGLLLFVGYLINNEAIAGGVMWTKRDKSFVNKLKGLEEKHDWLMLTEKTKRPTRTSYKVLFSICSLHSRKTKDFPINLYKSEEWCSKTLNEYILIPGKNYIAFAIRDWKPLTIDSNNAETHALYFLSIETGAITTIIPPTSDFEISGLCWSKTRNALLFTSRFNMEKCYKLLSIDINTHSIQTLFEYPKKIMINSQSLSPNEAKLVFETYKDGIFVYDFQADTAQKIDDGMWATWVPGTDTIVYFGKDENYYIANTNSMDKRIFIKNEDFGVQTFKWRHTQESIGKIGGELLWSPCGQYIYFERPAICLPFEYDEHYVPYIMDVNTRETIRLPERFSSGIKSWVGSN